MTRRKRGRSSAPIIGQLASRIKLDSAVHAQDWCEPALPRPAGLRHQRHSGVVEDPRSGLLGQSQILHLIQGHNLPLHSPEMDRFRNNSRSHRFFALLGRFSTPTRITALSKSECVAADWHVVAHKVEISSRTASKLTFGHQFSLSNDKLRCRFLCIRWIAVLGEQSTNRASHIRTDRLSLCPIECCLSFDAIG